MFYGEYEHTLDEKSRITLPARFRDAFADGVVLTRGLERNVDVFPRATWEESVAPIAALDSLTREARQMKRHVFAGAFLAELDRQGRVLVPPHLVQHAGLTKEVVVAGVRDRMEIWDRALWEARVREMEGSAADVAERLAEKLR
jgi:MraZ protein